MQQTLMKNQNSGLGNMDSGLTRNQTQSTNIQNQTSANSNQENNARISSYNSNSKKLGTHYTTRLKDRIRTHHSSDSNKRNNKNAAKT